MWRDGRITRMADDVATATNIEDTVKLTRNQRYHALHREERISKILDKYHKNPDVIAKKEERERKKAEKVAEKEAKKEAKRIEKERIRQEKLVLALATKRKSKSISSGLDAILNPESPASVK